MATALITGASAGLGLEFARLFAADKHDLVLVARRRDRLDALAEELAREHRVDVKVLAVDLMTAGAATQIVSELSQLGVELEFLVNNAGFGDTGAFTELTMQSQVGMLAVNVTTLTELCRAIIPGMKSRGHGRVLNIGSTAGFQPGPFMAVYYASKAYVNSFTEALSYELEGSGVTATLSCPGPTLTEFASVAGNDKSPLFKMGAMPARTVAYQAYRAMLDGDPMVIHGLMNAFSAFSVRLAPRALIRAVAAKLNQSSSGN
jgi:uncharacterized protein